MKSDYLIKNHQVWIVLLLLSVFSMSCNQNSEKRLLETFEKMQAELKQELQSSIKKSGFSGAIGVCQTASSGIEEKRSQDGMLVRRISLKNRSEKHLPDDYEKQVLLQWEREMVAGKKPGVVATKTDSGYRVMKPILLESAVCLKCHGTQAELDEKAGAEIKKLYPHDKATGYKIGDLRGAFSGIIQN